MINSDILPDCKQGHEFIAGNVKMSVTVQTSDNEVRIKPTGIMDFRLHKDFLRTYSNQAADCRYVIDMQQVSYIDSSAMGMLFLLREHAGGDSADISIINCSPDVRKQLMTANFGSYFAIV